jgi:HAD superfamily hydrolase (TIGR01484 family)
VSLPRGLRAVFLDVDGCLNPPDGESFSAGPRTARLSAGQSAMLARIGHAIDASPVEHVVLNTGRKHAHTRFIAKGLASSKVRYLILEHGSLVYDLAERRYVDPIDLARRFSLHDVARKYESTQHIARVIEWFAAEGRQQLGERLGVACATIEKRASLCFCVPEPLAAAQIHRELLSLVEAHPELQRELLTCHESADYLDVLGLVDKADGIAILLALLGVAPEQALAVGDGSNDRSAFEMLPHGFCPANASPELEALCRARGGWVAQRSYGDGVLELFTTLG